MSLDLRKYTKQTNLHLLIGFILLLFLAGDGLIYAFYGKGAAIMGLLCLGAGIAPLLLIGLILWAMEWFVKRAKRR